MIRGRYSCLLGGRVRRFSKRQVQAEKTGKMRLRYQTGEGKGGPIKNMI